MMLAIHHGRITDLYLNKKSGFVVVVRCCCRCCLLLSLFVVVVVVDLVNVLSFFLNFFFAGSNKMK